MWQLRDWELAVKTGNYWAESKIRLTSRIEKAEREKFRDALRMS